jgi:hypothetical protein
VRELGIATVIEWLFLLLINKKWWLTDGIRLPT